MGREEDSEEEIGRMLALRRVMEGVMEGDGERAGREEMES